MQIRGLLAIYMPNRYLNAMFAPYGMRDGDLGAISHRGVRAAENSSEVPYFVWESG